MGRKSREFLWSAAAKLPPWFAVAARIEGFYALPGKAFFAFALGFAWKEKAAASRPHSKRFFPNLKSPDFPNVMNGIACS
jgi:hypothetical protein